MVDVFEAATVRIDLQYLRDCMKGKYGQRGSREGLYQDVEVRKTFRSLVTSRFRTTLELVLEVSWESLRASVRWEGFQIGTTTT